MTFQNFNNENRETTILLNPLIVVPDENSRKVLSLWIYLIGLAAVLISALLAGFLTSWILIATAVFALAAIVLSIVIPRAFCKDYQVVFDGVSVRAKMGLIYKSDIFIPISAFRTFELVSTPLQKIFDCRMVIIRYAGGATLFPAMPKTDAERLIDALKNIEFSR